MFVVAVGDFPAEEGVEVGVASVRLDFIDKLEANVATNGGDFFVVDDVGPAEDKADPRNDQESVAVGRGGA